VPVAIATALATGGGGEPIVHFGIGTGMVLLAIAAFDFGLPRAAAWLGAIAAGAFGGIFLLQGVADALGDRPLWELAFHGLGQAPERILPDLLAAWFALAVAFGSRGRILGLGVILVGGLIAWEVVTLAGPTLGIAVPDIKLRWLLPFAWLLVASASRSGSMEAEHEPLEAIGHAA
jgi:hypothetical protein